MAVGETDCKWLGVTEVMRLLKDVNQEEVEMQVVSMMDSNPSMVGPTAVCSQRLLNTVNACVSRVCSPLQPAKSATFCGNLPKTYSMICLAHDQDDKNPRSRKVTKKSSFLSWGLKNKLKSASTLSLPTEDHSGSLPWNKPCPTFPSSSSYNNDSALF